MSFWLRRKNPDGRMYYITSGGWWIIVFGPAILGILIAIILPIVQSCGVWFRG
jgi:hypothetical protein